MRGITYDTPGVHFLNLKGVKYEKPEVEIDGQVFQLGEEVHIEDGVYIDFDVAIIIYNHRFIAVERHLFNKWKEELDMTNLVMNLNKK